jgi:hypothetical protein
MVEPAEIEPDSPEVVPPSRYVPEVEAVQMLKYGIPLDSRGIPVKDWDADVPPEATDPAEAVPKVIA